SGSCRVFAGSSEERNGRRRAGMISKGWRLATCNLLFCLPVLAQRPPSGAVPKNIRLTLAQAEAIALKNNPQVTVGKLRALVAQEGVREERSTVLPNLRLDLTGVESRPGSRVAAGGLNNPVVYPRAAAGAVLSQLITDFGRTTNLISSSQYQA